MNKRFTAFTLCLLCFMFAVVAGTLPHNHNGGSLLAHKDCIACAAHINGVADVSVAIAVVSYSSAEIKTFHSDRLHLSSYLFPSTASRAPPHTSA
jgi:hypothetical protein